MTTNVMRNGAERSRLEVQLGGAGNNWEPLDFEQTASMSAASLGRKPQQFKKVAGSRGEILVTVEDTGFVEDSTFELSTILANHQWISEVFGGDGESRRQSPNGIPFNLRFVQTLESQDSADYDYDYALMAIGIRADGAVSFGEMVRETMEGQDLVQSLTVPYAAAYMRRDSVPVHTLDSNMIVTQASKRAVYVKERDEVWATVDGENLVANPGVIWRKWYDTTWNTVVRINTSAQTSLATDIQVINGLVLVSTNAEGIHYATVRDLELGTATPFTLAAGWAAATQFPNEMGFADYRNGWAVGTAGYVWRTVDGGYTWTEFDAGVTTSNALNSIAIASKNLWYAGGASGTFLRFRQKTLEVLVVTGPMTDAINTVVTPEGRPDFVAIGTAAGEYHRTREGNHPYKTPTWEQIDFPGSGAVSSVVRLAFAGALGQYLFAIVTNGSSQSRIIRDDSGGAMAYNCVIIGDYTQPTNATISDIAIRNPGDAVTVGAVSGGVAFAGLISTAARS